MVRALVYRKESTTYTAAIDYRKLSRWFEAGMAVQSNAVRLKLRVQMALDGGEGYKDLPITLSAVQIPEERPQGAINRPGWFIDGEV
jgi:hypothetical protein